MIIIIYGSQFVWLTKPKTRLCMYAVLDLLSNKNQYYLHLLEISTLVTSLVVMVGQTRVGQTMGKADFG